LHSASSAHNCRGGSSIDLSALNGGFLRTLRAEDKSERTIKSYAEAVSLFADFLAGRGQALMVGAITRDHVAPSSPTGSTAGSPSRR